LFQCIYSQSVFLQLFRVMPPSMVCVSGEEQTGQKLYSKESIGLTLNRYKTY